ncbi:MAG: class I SAM-dependent rRNA methyltransferase [Xanthomonadales bacterium]|nr:class I SAM-dependent rRNA methyltransferase [Xanthomonadales bacterium]
MDRAAASTTLSLRKGEERRLLAGHEWVYSNEIDTARSPLRGLEAGRPAELVSQSGRWLAHVDLNPHSLIAARVVSRHRGRRLDRAELERRLRVAADWRERLYDEPFYRWVYGESDGLPGLVVDRYGPIAVVQINTAGMERRRQDIVDALVKVGATVGGVQGVLLRCDGELRELEGLDRYVETAFGQVPEEIEIRENGLPFVAPLAAGQKTGWFYDQSDNRRRARPLLSRGTVIDAFCYGGGWGVTAAVAGAERVIFIDGSEAALDYARRNAERNGVAERCEFLRADLPEALQQLAAEAPVGAVVVDPPAFVKRKKDLDAGTRAYQKLNERALALLGEGGVLVSCSCSQHVDRDAFQRIVQRAARRADCELRLLIEGGQSPDHPVHPAMPETRYLKSLAFAVGR